MKSKIIVLAGIMSMMMSLFIACGGNDSNPLGGCNGLSYAEAFQGDKYQDLVDASTNFSEQQTLQSCEVYKSELQEWFNLLAGLSSNCIAVPEQQYQESLAEAQEDIDEIDCSQYEEN
ncbi:MAG: hypothetical protein U5K72_11645 [Balneolaceae bacterium]|nr:hypothetical protein [Balneolaceae bacterium]